MNNTTMAGNTSNTQPQTFTNQPGERFEIAGPGSSPTYSPSSSPNQMHASGKQRTAAVNTTAHNLCVIDRCGSGKPANTK